MKLLKTFSKRLRTSTFDIISRVWDMIRRKSSGLIGGSIVGGTTTKDTAWVSVVQNGTTDERTSMAIF